MSDGARKVLTLNISVGKPRWSPNGKKIAFELSDGFEVSDVMIMNADGTQKQQLAVHDSLGGGYDTDPEWSPSGGFVLYSRGTFGVGGFITIIDTLQREHWTFGGDSLYLPVRYQGDTVYPMGIPRWGPTDDLVYMTCARSSDVFHQPFDELQIPLEIFSFDSHSGQIRNRLTYDSIPKWGFQVSRDGSKFLIHRGQREQNDSLIILSPAEKTKLIISIGEMQDERITNDGEEVVFTLGRKVYLLDFAHPETLRRLTDFDAQTPDLLNDTEVIYE